MRTWRLRVTDDLLARHTAGRWWSWSLYPPLILTLTLRITHGATNCLTTMGPGSLRGVRPRGQLRRSSLGRLRSGPRVLPGAGWREQEAAVVVSWTTWAEPGLRRPARSSPRPDSACCALGFQTLLLASERFDLGQVLSPRVLLFHP